MTDLTFEIIGTGKTVTIKVNTGSSVIRFFGIDRDTYFKRNKTYGTPSRRYQLLRWVGKNSTHNDADTAPRAPAVPKQRALTDAVRPAAKAAPKSTAIVPTRGQMVLEVEKQLAAKGYNVVKRKSITPMSKCHFTIKDGDKVKVIGCGDQSVIGGFKEVPEPKFVGVCFHRYDPNSKCNVVKVWNKEDAKAWLAKQAAA